MVALRDLLEWPLDEGVEGVDLADAPIEALPGLSADDAEALKRALNIRTIGEFGRNRHVLAAVAIAALAGPEAVAQASRASKRDTELIEQYIVPDPRRSGVEGARVRDEFVPVWALVGHYLGVTRDIEQVAKDYDLPKEKVEAALAYYRRHRAAIDTRLAANQPPSA